MATDCFVKFGNIRGGSLDKEFAGWHHVENCSWGEINPGSFATNSGGGAARVSMRDFECTMKIDIGFTALFLACAKGDHVDEAKVVFRRQGTNPQKYLTLTFKNCLVSGVDLSGPGGIEEFPMVNLRLNYGTMITEYRDQKDDGTSGGHFKAGFNLKQNSEVAA
jgi:type VI secretion system secreted protein Hcp